MQIGIWPTNKLATITVGKKQADLVVLSGGTRTAPSTPGDSDPAATVCFQKPKKPEDIVHVFVAGPSARQCGGWTSMVGADPSPICPSGRTVPPSSTQPDRRGAPRHPNPDAGH